MDRRMPKLLRKADVAAILGVRPGTLERWVQMGRFPAPFRSGGWVRWDEAEVERWIAERRRRVNGTCDGQGPR